MMAEEDESSRMAEYDESSACEDLDMLYDLRDASGYGCSYYTENLGREGCGWSDTSDFVSKELCCICEGGSTGENAPSMMAEEDESSRMAEYDESGACEDLDMFYGVVDMYSNGCNYYTENMGSFCGM